MTIVVVVVVEIIGFDKELGVNEEARKSLVLEFVKVEESEEVLEKIEEVEVVFGLVVVAMGIGIGIGIDDDIGIAKTSELVVVLEVL